MVTVIFKNEKCTYPYTQQFHFYELIGQMYSHMCKIICTHMEMLVAQLCPTLCDPMVCPWN